MNFKNALWALAFACAAVSCSDDLENGPNNNEGNELNGETAFVRVAINTGAVTRANGGEGKGTELGEEPEYKVDDVTIILFDNANNNDSGVNKEGFEFLSGSNIRGVGFSNVQEQGSSNLSEHGWEASVEVTMDESQSASLFDKTYGVIAVTNLGGTQENPNDLYKLVKAGSTGVEGKTITTGKELGNYLQTNAWSDNSSKFIMSTHAMKWPATSGVESVVKIEPNVSEDNAPVVNVYVERLAAKIRIKQQENISNFIYTLKDNDQAKTELGKVRLDQVAIVNQLNSGSYLLKRVTENNPTQFTENMTVKYLGDEAWTSDNTNTNYVLDPWTAVRNNKAELKSESSTQSNATLSYLNRFEQTGTEETGMVSYSTRWNEYASKQTANEKVKSLATATEADFNDNGGIRLAYTQENVTQADHSLNGYSTGALFKATYFPQKMTKLAANGISTETPDVDDYESVDKDTEGGDFYVYGNNVYDSQEPVFVDYLTKHTTSASQETGFNYSKFTSENFGSMKVAEFKLHFSNVNDPFGYIEDLNKKIAAYEEGESAAEDPTMNDVEGAQDFNTFMTGKDKKNINDVIYYEKGVCYYTYWIRHGDNGNPAKMGIMEFAIVRNNIYDLTVSDINSLGASGTEPVPPTETPNEDGTAKIKVQLYVKNWVVRSNSGIIL